jgi:glycerophosphoryl diester phosphodiesterase
MWSPTSHCIVPDRLVLTRFTCTRLSSARTLLAASVLNGIEVHAWDVNTVADLELAVSLGLPVVCTDHPEQAMRWRANGGAGRDSES